MLWSAGLTLATMFGLGVARGFATEEIWWEAGLESLLMGSVVAAAYAAGALAAALIGGMLRAFHTLATRADVEHVVIQPMIADGTAMFVGATSDADFGHLIVWGAGGTTVELLRDTAHRLAPLSRSAASAMLDQVRSTRLLRGFRGRAVLDESAFRQVVLRVSALVEAAPEIGELDLNPVVVTQKGAWVVDARFRITEPTLERQPAFV